MHRKRAVEFGGNNDCGKRQSFEDGNLPFRQSLRGFLRIDFYGTELMFDVCWLVNLLLFDTSFVPEARRDCLWCHYFVRNSVAGRVMLQMPPVQGDSTVLVSDLRGWPEHQRRARLLGQPQKSKPAHVFPCIFRSSDILSASPLLWRVRFVGL